MGNRDISQEVQIEWIPFQWFENGIVHESRVITAVLHTMLYVPVGFLLYQLRQNKKVIVAGCAISIIMETVQYLCGFGTWKLETVLLNTLGVVLGVMIEKEIWRRKHMC